jgi:2-polyprenyl-6-methoxyphenol hydroxylase-like FAD-dependent oxidoreductase
MAAMRVLICGAGIAGLTLAWCLERKGHHALVLERAPEPREEGYMVDFFGSGYDASEKMGLLPDLERIHYPIARLKFVDEGGYERLSLPYRTLRKRLFQDRHFNFMRGDLERVLFQKIAECTEVRFGTTVDAFETIGDGIRVDLSDGSTHVADLLVGADGVHSKVRRLAFGEEPKFARFVGCYTAAFVIDRRPEAFGVTDAFVTLTVPGWQVAVYPVRGGALAAFFVHRSARHSDDFSREAVFRELRDVYGHLGWLVPELIDQAARASNLYFDAVTQIVMPSWSRDRVVLLGDACQCVSLLAGQGASMAVASAYILAEEIEAAGVRYLGNALATYEHRIKPSIERKQAVGRNMADWFVPADGLHLALRDLALRVSVWPGASSIIRHRLEGQSVFA